MCLLLSILEQIKGRISGARHLLPFKIINIHIQI
jgi:hypothetical protein